MDKKHFNNAMDAFVATVIKFKQEVTDLPDFNHGKWSGKAGGWYEFFHDYAPVMYTSYEDGAETDSDKRFFHKVDEIVTFDTASYDANTETLLLEWGSDWYKVYGVKPEALDGDIDLVHGEIKLKGVLVEVADFPDGKNSGKVLQKVCDIRLSWVPEWPTPEILD